MPILPKVRKVVEQAGQSIADAMKVAIFACALSVLALVVAIVGLTRPRAAA
jgi:hypothetical protein